MAEAPAPLTEVQVDVGDVDATGNRMVETACSRNSSSGQVVPERPGDALSIKSASGGSLADQLALCSDDVLQTKAAA